MIKKIFLQIIELSLLFVITIIVLDILLSFFLEKDFYKSLGVGGGNIENHGDITNEFQKMYPESEFELTLSGEKEAGSLFWLPKDKRWYGYGTGECIIYGLGDSITYGMGVKASEEYLSKLSDSFTNTKIYNYAVNGHGIYQSYLMNKNYIEKKDKDLLIWQFFGDDFLMFKYMFGRIYNTSLNIDYLENKPILSRYLGNNINNFLLENSYLYNKLLIIKIKNSKKEIKHEEYLLGLLEDFLKMKRKENVLAVFGLDYEIDVIEHNRKERRDYKIIMDLLNKYNVPYINLANKAKKEMFLSDGVHFNKAGHKIVSDIIFDKIKEEKLLPLNCY